MLCNAQPALGRLGKNREHDFRRTQTLKTIERNVTQHKEKTNGCQNQPIELQFKRQGDGLILQVFITRFTGKQNENRRQRNQERLITKSGSKLTVQKIMNCPKRSATGAVQTRQCMKRTGRKPNVFRWMPKKQTESHEGTQRHKNGGEVNFRRLSFRLVHAGLAFSLLTFHIPSVSTATPRMTM